MILADNLYISRINYIELIYGVYNSARIEQNLKIIEPFLENFKILEFDKNSSLIFIHRIILKLILLKIHYEYSLSLIVI